MLAWLKNFFTVMQDAIRVAPTNSDVRKVLADVSCIKLTLVMEELTRLDASAWKPTTAQLQYLWQLFAGKPFTKGTLEDIFGTLRAIKRRSPNGTIGQHRTADAYIMGGYI